MLRKVLAATSDAKIGFDALCSLMTTLGFEMRVRGSHRIFTKDGVEEILNLPPRGASAKPYQVKQVRQVIVRYGFAGEADE